jgi:hypothetical protein
MQITYRPPDLGSHVRPPRFGLWTPPPALKASQDPYLLHRAIKGLRRIGGPYTAPPRRAVPASRLYGSAGPEPDRRSQEAPERPLQVARVYQHTTECPAHSLMI